MLSVRAFAAVFLAVIVAAPAAGAQGDDRPQRVVVYVNADHPRVARAISVLERAFGRAGVHSRHRVKVIHLKADLSDAQQIDRALRHAIKLQPDVIVAPNSNAAAAAKALSNKVPVVFASHQDPVTMGLVQSLARPGGNLTGFTSYVPIDQKILEILRQIAPQTRKLGIVIDKWWVEESGGREVMSQAHSRHGFEPQLFRAENLAELRKELATTRASEMDAWYVPYTVLPFGEPAEFLAALDVLRKPVAFPATLFVERGGLFSYQPVLSLEEGSLLWATMIGLILDGVSPAEIPIERPKAFELVVNAGAARRLGLQLPAALLKRADRVIIDPPGPQAKAK